MTTLSEIVTFLPPSMPSGLALLMTWFPTMVIVSTSASACALVGCYLVLRRVSLLGDAIGHADIAVACVIRFTREAHRGVFDTKRWPALAAHAEQCEALPPFQEIAQPFSAPGT